MNASGNWNLVVRTPFGEQKIKTRLVDEAGTLTGTMDDDRNPAGPIEDGTVDGSRISFRFPVKKPFPTTLAFTLSLENDALTGTCKAGVFPPAPTSGSRVRA